MNAKTNWLEEEEEPLISSASSWTLSHREISWRAGLKNIMKQGSKSKQDKERWENETFGKIFRLVEIESKFIHSSKGFWWRISLVQSPCIQFIPLLSKTNTIQTPAPSFFRSVSLSRSDSESSQVNLEHRKTSKEKVLNQFTPACLTFSICFFVCVWLLLISFPSFSTFVILFPCLFLAQMGDEIMFYNGCGVIAMVGKNCVAIASDTRFGVQNQTVADDLPRIYKMHDLLYVGFNGLITDMQTM